MTFKEYVEQYKNGFSYRDLGHWLGLSRGYVFQLMTGARTPSLKVARRIQDLTDGKVPIEAWNDAA